MKKIILKSSLITVAALAAAGILIFSLWILISPQSMATVSEKLGNYDFAVTCANLKYKYSDETIDLARCAEDSILSGEDKLIVKYCEKLIEREDFDELCLRRNDELARTQYGRFTTDYETYIKSNLSVSQYRTGDLKKAVATAESGEMDCFKRLAIEIRLKGSDEDKENLLKYITDDATKAYVKGILELPLQ